LEEEVFLYRLIEEPARKFQNLGSINMNVLHIQSSPRGDKSTSIALTKAFLSASRKILPTIDEDVLNVWNESLPEFDAESIHAKYKAIKHEPMTDAESHTWNRIQELIRRFQRAKRIVLGLPMWNFSIPYKLKQLIDLTAQRNYLFTYDGKEYGPSLNIPRALVVYTRGSTYREGTPIPPSFDHQAPYIDFWLRMIGVREVHNVIVDNAWNLNDAQSAASVAAAKRSVERIAGDFW
jgi:FMN-dependent NADH-azoreductase